MSRSSEDAQTLLGKRKKNIFGGFTVTHARIFIHTEAVIGLCNIKGSASLSAANKHETAHT